MSRKLIVGLVAVVAVAGLGLAAGSALSGTDDQGPRYTPLTIDLAKQGGAVHAKAGVGGSSKPEVVYLESSTPTTINTADPNPADPNDTAVGPYVSLTLKGCSKVVNGGVVPHSTDVFVQGSEVLSAKKYRVLIALDDAAVAASPRPTFQVDTNLTCLKGVK